MPLFERVTGSYWNWSSKRSQPIARCSATLHNAAQAVTVLLNGKEKSRAEISRDLSCCRKKTASCQLPARGACSPSSSRRVTSQRVAAVGSDYLLDQCQALVSADQSHIWAETRRLPFKDQVLTCRSKSSCAFFPHRRERRDVWDYTSSEM